MKRILIKVLDILILVVIGILLGVGAAILKYLGILDSLI